PHLRGADRIPPLQGDLHGVQGHSADMRGPGGAMTATPTHLLYRAHFGEPVPTGPAICWLCGESCPEVDSTEEISRAASKVVRPTFTDHDRGRASDSDVFCHACAWYFDYKILRP